jgi:hypothetical protein
MVKSVELWLDGFWKVSSTPRAWTVPSCAANPADVDPSNKVFPFCFEFESVGVSVIFTMSWAVTTQLYSNVIQIHDLVQARLGRDIELEDLLAQADTTVIDVASKLEASSQNTQLFTAEKGRTIQDIQSEGTRMARSVCQSMEYYHRIEMGTYGSQATTYTSWAARQYFRLHPGHDRELSWLQNIHKMEGPGIHWGRRMMAFADVVEPLGSLLR